ncbi:MAG: thiamine pyrophosphate-dependent dehydrogenase E1 component subunit alpha, partial [Anaerolineaceae bacterium]|nr:thiamine pyrophosphate-dependent dehydrogenase E1 component subunit alpha [Anaerolineaceae bacterium]
MLSNLELYRQMLLIRRFEEKLLDSFKTGIFFGTTHTAIGQEADAVGVLSCLAENDIVVSNHRCHGHFLAYGGDPESLFAELMGSPAGVCGGRGGSQHLHWRNFYSNGIQGGIVPMATGMALAEKYKGSDAVTVVFMGDGTLGEGVVYESLNMAALWQAPILFVLENNHIAQTTPIDLALAGEISVRFDAFTIENMRIDSSDVLEIQNLAKKLIDKVRQEKKPHALIIDTIRFSAHSKGDDTRSETDMAVIRTKRDPLT